ncbi:asparagine synthase-related protein [Paenibacillus kobensis]|uniref:asparagine synthase-related protein n=1 Tax=Paenibacillus kobensis TaxID=59841 RepID=UPI000FD6EEE3|nr:asparagine synthase-related protein [Paenibacillus kobensis]
MSAIIGVLHLTAEPVPYDLPQRMMLALQRYPANDVRTWHGGLIGMGCHAQWVTPESVNEKLPYYSAGHNLAITADAIIDNREELFGRLRIEWPRRKNITDSELIMLAYVKWGEEAPRYLIGDFTFVIWDANKQQLFGARDMLGNRTLHYYYDQKKFAFSTVIPPLFEIEGVKKQLNETWLAQFLAIPTMLEVADVNLSAYNRIQHLPPAHSFMVANGKLKLAQYNAFEFRGKSIRFRSNGEYEEAFREVFQTAIASKVRTYRQVGSSLSGGLDSGAVVSFAAEQLSREGKTLHTYSSIPPSDFIDWSSRRRFANESPYIEATVQHVRTLKHQYLDFAEVNPLTEVMPWLEMLNAPYKCFENSHWLRGIFERAKQDDVGILLTGSGGNLSVSWGSGIDYYGHLLKRLKWPKLYRELKLYGSQMKIRRKHLLQMIVPTAFPMLDKSSATLAKSFPSLIHPDYARKTKVFEQLHNVEVGSPDSKLNFIEARENEFRRLVFPHMSGTLGTQLSLNYAIWERDPTYDPRVIQFCLSVPLEQYVQDGIDRSLIRRATQGYLPDKVRLNQRLRGIQGSDWLHRVIPSWNLIMDELNSLCEDRRYAEILNIEQIKKSRDVIGSAPRPDQAYDSDARMLMRSLIVYRFLKQLA